MSRDAGAVTFRAARAEDADAVVSLVESAYRGEASRVGWTTEASLLEGQRTDVEAVLAIVAAPTGRLLLAERHGERHEMVACCHLEPRGEATYFGMFAVRPESQGGGLGKVVMGEAERIAREEWHTTSMEMTVIEQREDLIAFYERRGFRRTGAFEPFPYGDERFGRPLRDDLRFAVLAKAL